MGSSKLKCKILPEEKVRQRLLHELTHFLGFPKELVAVEKQLSELPHLQGQEVPKRRIDILCYRKEGADLYPLLLIECKKGDVGRTAQQQALGYNHFIQAPFVAVAGKLEAGLIFPQTIDFIPHFDELVKAAMQ